MVSNPGRLYDETQHVEVPVNSDPRHIVAAPLGEVLRAVRLRGTVYFQARMSSPWGMEMPSNAVAAFHVVVRGEAWVEWDGDPVQVGAGDIVVFMAGLGHRLTHAPGATCAFGPDLLPTLIAEGEWGGGGAETILTCGHFTWDSDVPHPLFESMKQPIVVRANEQDDPAWVRTVSELAVAESERGDTGSPEVVDRLAEVLLIGVLRAWAEAQNRPSGFLGALGDPGLARALSAMHRAPEQPWTLPELARTAGMSRTVFVERFREHTGWTPALYLTHWRMRRAKELLTTGMSLADVADKVGYANEFGFAKAFKRVFGEAPGAARRRLSKGPNGAQRDLPNP